MPASHVNLSTVQTTSPTELETAVPTWAYMDQPRARASIQAFWDACMTHSDDFDLIYVKHPRICRRGPFVFLTDMGTKTTQEQDAEEYGLSIEPDRVISVVEDSKRLSVLEAPNHDSAWPHDGRLFFTENGAEGTEAVYLLERKAGSATAEVKQSTSASCSSKYALEFNEVSSPSV